MQYNVNSNKGKIDELIFSQWVEIESHSKIQKVWFRKRWSILHIEGCRSSFLPFSALFIHSTKIIQCSEPAFRLHPLGNV